MTPRTILLKLSGEALVGDRKFGIDTDILDYLSKEISDVKDKFKKRQFSEQGDWN